MVTIVPSFIITLMTSAAFTAMRCASSPTVIVSGTAISRTTGSVGATKVGCSPLGATGRWRAPTRECQPATPPPASPRVLIVRRRAESSFRMVVVLAFFAFLSPLPSSDLGFACSVPSVGAAGAG